jgi:ketosteroid isomerase-like protein
MRRAAIATTILAISMTFAVASRLQAGQAVDVPTLEANWARALLATDMKALEAMFSDDLVYIHSTGGLQNKKDYLDSIRTGNLRYKSITPVGSPRFRTFGNTATVSSRYDLELESGRSGKITPYTIQYLTVYVNEGGTWRIVAQQTTSVPKRP